MEEYILYKLSFPNGKIYIGYTSKPLDERIKGHKYHAKNNWTKKRTPVMNAILKYMDDFSYEKLFIVNTIEEAYKAEIDLIAKNDATNFKIGYNVSLGGDGIRHTAYTKAKIGKGSIITNTRRFAIKVNVEKQSEALKARWAIPGAKQELAIKKGAKPFLIIDAKTGSIIAEFLSQRECAKQFDVSPGFINNCLKGRRKGTEKYTFRYKEP